MLALPDLEVTAITDPPAAAPPGHSFKVTNTVRNAGMVPSPGAATKYSLLSTSNAAPADLDGTQSVPGLTPGQTFTDEETVTIRGNTPVGEYRLQACADAGKAVSEDDEADNCLLSAGTILVTTLPDLRLGTVTLAGAPVVVTPGGTIDVRCGGPERGRRRCRRVDDHVRAGERGRHREEPGLGPRQSPSWPAGLPPRPRRP